MSSVIYSEYTPQPDGSGIVTETFDDGSQRVVRLPPPFVVDRGPLWNTTEDEDAIRLLDRKGR